MYYTSLQSSHFWEYLDVMYNGSFFDLYWFIVGFGILDAHDRLHWILEEVVQHTNPLDILFSQKIYSLRVIDCWEESEDGNVFYNKTKFIKIGCRWRNSRRASPVDVLANPCYIYGSLRFELNTKKIISVEFMSSNSEKLLSLYFINPFDMTHYLFPTSCLVFYY